jgi:hypothetical protein
MKKEDRERIEKQAEIHATELSSTYTDRFKKLRKSSYIAGATSERERNFIEENPGFFKSPIDAVIDFIEENPGFFKSQIRELKK